MIRNLAVHTQKGGGKDSFQKPTDPLFGGRVPHRDHVAFLTCEAVFSTPDRAIFLSAPIATGECITSMRRTSAYTRRADRKRREHRSKPSSYLRIRIVSQGRSDCESHHRQKYQSLVLQCCTHLGIKFCDSECKYEPDPKPDLGGRGVERIRFVIFFRTKRMFGESGITETVLLGRLSPSRIFC